MTATGSPGADARLAAMKSALRDCAVELGWLIRQTKAREGGSVDRAYKAACVLLGDETPAGQASGADATQHWAVSVERNGKKILTIESNMLSGRELSAKDEDCIRNCARNLLSFLGASGADALTPQLEQKE